MKGKKITVIGGDKRQKYLISALAEAGGYEVFAYGINDDDVTCCNTLMDSLLNSYAVVLPFPLTPDGVYLNATCKDCNIRLSTLFDLINQSGVKYVFGGAIKSCTQELAREYGISLIDYGKSEELLLKNALCTAEGAIEIAMHELPINLHASNSVVIGYGRIGRLLSARLKALGSSVCVVARRREALALAECDGFDVCEINDIKAPLKCADVIFNTAPSMILDGSLLPVLKTDSLVIDLASSPGGVDFTQAKKLGINVIWALSLPGKCSPKSAALIIASVVLEQLKIYDGNEVDI